MNNGVNARQWACENGNTHQEWQFIPIGTTGYYSIVARHSGKCLDSEQSLPFDGTNVHTWTCISEATNQRWYLQTLSTGSSTASR